MNEEGYSKNIDAGLIVGYRHGNALAIDFPGELGYHCPVCEYGPNPEYDVDERLYWSEYQYFLWCSVCNKDYPSVLCIEDIDKATDAFLKIASQIKESQHA